MKGRVIRSDVRSLPTDRLEKPMSPPLGFLPGLISTGYRQGQGLGKDAKGPVEPLKPEVGESDSMSIYLPTSLYSRVHGHT